MLRKKSCLGVGVGVEHRSAYAPPASATSTSSSDGIGCTNASHVHNVLERLVGEPCRPHGCVKSSMKAPPSFSLRKTKSAFLTRMNTADVIHQTSGHVLKFA